MVNTCSAYGCKERFRKGSPNTFHSFPKDEKIRKLWEKSLKRKDFVSTKNSKVCSKHFEPHHYDTERFGGTWLKPNAVPTVFDFPSYLDMKMIVKGKMFEQHPSDNQRAKIYCDLGAFTEEELKLLKEKVKVECYKDRRRAKRYRFLGDFTEEDMDSPEKSRKFLQMAKNLQLENGKIKAKIEFLKEKAASIQKAINTINLKGFSSGIVIEDDSTSRVAKNVNNYHIVTD